MQRRRGAAKVLHRGEPVAASTEAQETAQHSAAAARASIAQRVDAEASADHEDGRC